jgi:hypothetical protein
MGTMIMGRVWELGTALRDASVKRPAGRPEYDRFRDSTDADERKVGRIGCCIQKPSNSIGPPFWCGAINWRGTLLTSAAKLGS